MTVLTRRKFAAGVALLPLLAGPGQAQTALPKMLVAKDPSCSCCGSWVGYLRANGFTVEIIESTNMDGIKAALGVPAALQSCHTAEIGSYVVEGLQKRGCKNILVPKIEDYNLVNINDVVRKLLNCIEKNV